MIRLVKAAGARQARLGRCPIKIALLHTRRQYPDAIAALNSLQTNFAIVDQIRKEGKSLNRLAIPEMIDWLKRAGYTPPDLNAINIVHIAGTKGKGSTATFVASILDQYRRLGQLGGVGLYTSPHLRHVRERIQINGDVISEAAFSKGFFELWDRFEAAERSEGKALDSRAKPLYFRYLTLLAFHIYLKRGIDTAVFECGIGGEYDSTNIVPSPTVTGITSIGLDHVDLLGSTLGEIAWHKAGIIKSGIPAYTSAQVPEVIQVLHERARARGVTLQVVREHPDLTGDTMKLGLAGSFQKMNASLAIEVAAAHLRRLGHRNITTSPLPVEFLRGLEQAHLGGRCETREEANVLWHLDGAHTIESMQGAAQWFSECITTTSESVDPTTPRILIFNQQTRDAPKLLGELYRKLATHLGPAQCFSHVIFCTNRTFKSSGYSADLVSINTDDQAVEALSVQHSLAAAWRSFEANKESTDRAEVSVLTSIEEAIALARSTAAGTSQGAPSASDRKCHVLITGSVHLVGGALEVLETPN